MAQSQQRPGLTPQPDGTWQYAVHRIEIGNVEDYAHDMNELGGKGWELVSALPLSVGKRMFHEPGNTNAVMMIWKRRVG